MALASFTFANYYQIADKSMKPPCRILLSYARVFLTRLEQQVQKKEALEKELYSRFVMVLNKKKAKIRGLQEAVNKLRNSDDHPSDEEGVQRSASSTVILLSALKVQFKDRNNWMLYVMSIEGFYLYTKPMIFVI